jgi:glycosyltransferase involved in cell wall biosynthesis
MLPQVSVIIPSYNVAAYIEQALRTVLAQTFQDYEILVINDGSKDNTVELASAFTDSRIRIISQANRGLAGARNAGIRAARGEFLAFLDADDLWHPEKLERHVALLRSKPNVGVTYSQSAFIDDDAKPLGYYQRPKLTEVDARDVFLRNPIGNGSAPVIRAATLRDIGYVPDMANGEIWYFDETFRQSEDIECWVRIALQTRWGFEGIGLPLTLYRVNTGGLSANLGRQFETWERMVEKARAINPAFVALHEAASRGYQLRYLARRAIRMGDTGTALRLLARSLDANPAMLIEEPARTLATVAAVVVQACLPAAGYRRLEAACMRVAHAR